MLSKGPVSICKIFKLNKRKRVSEKHLLRLYCLCHSLWLCSVHFSHSVLSNSLWPRGLQHVRPPCQSSTPRVYSNSCLSIRWCHPTISSSVVPVSSHLQSFPSSGSFQMNQLFASGGQGIGVSASTSVLPTNIQDWFPLGGTGWISLQQKGLSRVLWLCGVCGSEQTVENSQRNGSIRPHDLPPEKSECRSGSNS